MIKEGKMTFTDADDNAVEVNVKDFKIVDPEWWRLFWSKRMSTVT